MVLPCFLQEDVKKIYVNQDEKNGFYEMFKSHFTIGLIKYVLLNLPYPDYRASMYIHNQITTYCRIDKSLLLNFSSASHSLSLMYSYNIMYSGSPLCGLKCESY